jgi:hypothetical protein
VVHDVVDVVVLLGDVDLIVVRLAGPLLEPRDVELVVVALGVAST